MQQFKGWLKQAIQLKAAKLELVVGQAPRALGLTEPMDGQMKEEQYQAFCRSFFPKDYDQIRQGQPAKGTLSVVGVGEMYLIAVPRSKALTVYLPPNGADLFKSEWASLLMAKNVRSPAKEDRKQGSPLPFERVPISAQNPEEPSSQDLAPPPPKAPAQPGLGLAPKSDPLAMKSPETGELKMPPIESMTGLTGIEMPDLGPSPEVSMSSHDALTSLEPSSASMASFSLPNELPQPPPPASPPPLSDLSFPDLPEPQESEPAPSPLPGLADFPSSPGLELGVVPKGSPVPASPPPASSQESGFASEKKGIVFSKTIPGTSSPVGDFPINRLLEEMVKRKASDLHLTMGCPPILRVDGEMQPLSDQPVDGAQMSAILTPIFPGYFYDQFAQENDTDFSYELAGVGRFRVNIFRDRNGVGAVLRQIPTKVLTADDLGLNAAIRKFTRLTKGLVLVTGPTGSGKSTTLAAMIDLINSTRNEHVITIEDPIEFVHEQKKCLINQREVHNHTQSFTRALRAALREDPDIVLIGEMRDLETIAIAIETAETGHLVFGTLHTTTAISTVDRIIDQFPEAQQNQVRSMLANSLRGVISQTLLKRVGGGRVAAQEIMVVSKSIASLIRDNKVHMIANDMQTKKAEGNVLMRDAILDLIKAGIISAQEGINKSPDPSEFAAFLESKGMAVA